MKPKALTPPIVRNPYNYDADQLSNDTGLKCEDESLCRQEFAAEADINYVAETFMKTGQVKHVLNMPTSGDFSGTFDFQSSMNLIVKAQQEFGALPAKIRSRFDNDPQKLLSFLEDETNRDEAVALGLIPKPQEPVNDARTERSTPAAPQETKRPRGAETDARTDARTEKSGRKTTETD